MTLIELEELPETERRVVTEYNSCKDYLNKFMAMNVKVAWVLFGPDEYANVTSAYGSFTRSCHRFGFPVTAYIRNGDLYLVRTDM